MSIETVDTGLPKIQAPFEWATRGGNTLYTAQVPIRADGSIETGSIERQAELTLANLKQSVEAAGGSLRDVAQVLVFLTDVGDAETVNETWRRFFAPPYPNRATMIVAGLAIPGMRIELVAHAHLTPR
jgi:enamine deaminase RidA (YjgF/YER057c/UK114 family)